MATEGQKKISYKLNIDKYLKQLNCFVTNVTNKSTLLSLDETVAFQNRLKNLSQGEKKSFEIPFEEKNSERFKKYIAKLQDANPSAVSIWIDGTTECGTLSVNSLSEIRWDFAFDCDSGGILVLTTNDLEDKILLDWSEDKRGEQILELEVIGKNWSTVSYG